ncbi:hypothetical protein [Paractinoplanes toevensis]|uniref:CU044_5270 family protein n=1 Tax=Paractinoplanes toevensis TaxID=571911 RepID=A0A919THY4_9ACTN|nr:hypothetical protein [Actinoplanes toevensis]GIM94394.1 hypothetical protein Ato02nite_061870 [Actinoplanes toevensis]
MTETPQPQQRPRRWRPALYLAITVALVLLGAAVVARLSLTARPAAAEDTVFGPPTGAVPAGPGACAPPNPLTLHHLRDLADWPAAAPTALAAPTQPARDQLRDIAAGITTGLCDGPGRYAYVQLRQWALDSHASGGRTELTPAVTQYEHWLADNGSGRSIAVTTRTPATDNPPSDDSFPPGTSPATPDPAATDPTQATTCLARNTAAGGPRAALTALADLNQWQTPTPPSRAALLRALADTNGLTYQGTVVDRAGRTGVAVSATSDNSVERELLIIDPASGHLLAHEQAALRDPGALGISKPAVVSYTLFVARGHTDTVQQR